MKMEFRYSAIDTSYRCLKKYQYQYVLGIKPETGSYDLHFGSCLHIALNSILENNCFSKNALEVYEAEWQRTSPDNADYGRYNRDDYFSMAKAFLDKFERLHYKNYDPLYLEVYMQFMVDKYKFSGTADFIGNYKGVPSIIDFKTSASPYEPAKIEVNEQLYLYAYAAKQVFGFEAKQIVYSVFVKNNERRIQTVVFPLTDKKLSDMLDNVRSQCKLISEQFEFPKNRNSCLIGGRKCEYYKRCYGSENKQGD